MKTKKIAFCGIMAALATVVMLTGYFPYLTYTVPCVAALAIMVVVLEFGKLYGLMTFLASILPVMLFCEPECKLVYVFAVGYYPVLKCLYERLHHRVLEYVLKWVGFNVSLVLIYLLATFVFGVTYEELQGAGSLIIGGFLIAANVVLFLYDFLLTRLAGLYFERFHRTVSRILKKK